MTKDLGQISRMLELMDYKTINESTDDKVNNSVQYKTIGADGKTYGIVREGTKFYIKVADNETDSLDYIGGFCNRKLNEHKSYAMASKQLEFKLMSLNEACNKFTDVKVLDLDKKETLAVELTESMRREIAREKQLMEETAKITSDNVGVPEAPETQEFEISIGAPYEEKIDAKLDKDFIAKADKPEDAGDPFEEKTEAELDKDLTTKADKPEDAGDPFEEKSETEQAETEGEDIDDKEKQKVTEDIMSDDEAQGDDNESDENSEDESEDEDDDKEKYISGLVESIIKDFGNHPSFRKSPIKMNSGEKCKPYATEIGDSDPYDEVAKLLTDAIVDKLTKSDFLKKKSK